jgi:8-oxo-dGTP diphosphatase
MAEATACRTQRIGAYAWCVSGDQILLSRFSAPDCRWGPPGGGVEHGELPAAAVAREVREETGVDVEVGRVIDVYSNVWGTDPVIHAISIVFEVRPVGGKLRAEAEGSSDQVEWVDLDHLEQIKRTWLLDAVCASMGQG